MAKIIEYPRGSLRSALQLAEAVDSFAGSCSPELAAEKLGKKISGAFSAQIGAASKYRLIENKSGKLSVTTLYRNYKLAYTPEEANTCLREALLSPPLFKAIYDRFKGQKLPIDHFQKMLIKEFEVPDEAASRVAGYFLDGAKQSGLLNSDNTWTEPKVDTDEEIIEEVKTLSASAQQITESNNHVTAEHAQRLALPTTSPVSSEDFHLSIKGPGTSFAIEIRELDDLEIVQIMLRKIEKAMKLRESSQ